MEGKDKSFVKGYKVDTITTFERLRSALINLLRGYPIYWYYGIIESYFEDNLGNQVVDVLGKDNIIEIRINEKENRREYRLTERGVDVVTALLNQKHSEDVIEYNKKVLKHTERTQELNERMIYLTKILVVVSFGLLIFSFTQNLINLWF